MTAPQRPGPPGQTGARAAGTPRPLTGGERQLLDGLLAHEFPGVRELREQVSSARAIPGCGCGCGTIDFVLEAGAHAPASTAQSPVPVEGEVHDGGGQAVGGLLLFLTGGRLGGLEVFSYGEEPLPLPDPRHVTWELREQR